MNTSKRADFPMPAILPSGTIKLKPMGRMTFESWLPPRLRLQLAEENLPRWDRFWRERGEKDHAKRDS